MWGVSLTHPVLFYVGSFSYTPRATECGEFLLHTPCYFMWGVSLARPLLESFIRTAVKAVVTIFTANNEHFAADVDDKQTIYFTHPALLLMWGVSLTRPVLLYVCVGFCYTPHAILCEEFLLHAPHSTGAV